MISSDILPNFSYLRIEIVMFQEYLFLLTKIEFMYLLHQVSFSRLFLKCSQQEVWKEMRLDDMAQSKQW